jgi:hypothetical protein
VLGFQLVELFTRRINDFDKVILIFGNLQPLWYEDMVPGVSFTWVFNPK